MRRQVSGSGNMWHERPELYVRGHATTTTAPGCLRLWRLDDQDPWVWGLPKPRE